MPVDGSRERVDGVDGRHDARCLTSVVERRRTVF
jgi:hypothetical protein